MHKGRQYPFLFEYWATNSQYWPFYVPRKMRMVSISSTLGSDWHVGLDPELPFNSLVGSYLAGNPDVVWHWDLSGGAGFAEFSWGLAPSPGADAPIEIFLSLASGAFCRARTLHPYHSIISLNRFFTTSAIGGGFNDPDGGCGVLMFPATWSQGGGI